MSSKPGTTESFSFPKWFVRALRDFAKRSELNKSHFVFEKIGPEVVRGDEKLERKFEAEIERRRGDEE